MNETGRKDEISFLLPFLRKLLFYRSIGCVMMIGRFLDALKPRRFAWVL